MKRTILILALTITALVTNACTAAPTLTSAPPTVASAATPQSTEIPIPTEAPKPTAATLPNLKGRALKVGSDTNYPPFESVNDQKQIVGFDVELVNEICKQINCKATFSTADFERLLSTVNNKTFDFSVSGWTITDDRSKTVDFGLPYMQKTQVLLVRADETRIKQPEDLKKPEALVAVQLSTASSSAAKQLVADPSKQVKEFQDFADAVQALISKQANVVVANIFDAADVLDQNNGRIKSTGKQFGNEYLGMVFRKGDAELKNAFDAGLKAIYKDGTWSKLCTKWWMEIDPKPDCTGAGLPLGK